MPWPKPKFERIARFAPLIGLLIGCIQAFAWLLLDLLGWPKASISLSILTLGLFLTGGLHIDGLMDTADGLAAGRKKCLSAMQDSRVGSSGVQALFIILGLQISALLKLDSYSPIALLIAAFWGRCAPLWAIGNFPYLHKQTKESFHLKNWKGLNEIIPASIVLMGSISTIYLLPFFINQNIKLIFFTIIGIIPTILIPHYLGIRLGGHSGDTYGASLVIVETVILLSLAMLL